MRSPLVGKLFDETGERLTPSHAVKGNRRYRYYVSSSLLKGAADQTALGWLNAEAATLERRLLPIIGGARSFCDASGRWGPPNR